MPNYKTIVKGQCSWFWSSVFIFTKIKGLPFLNLPGSDILGTLNLVKAQNRI